MFKDKPKIEDNDGRNKVSNIKSNYGSKIQEKKGPQPILPKQIISPNTLINKSKN